MHLLCGLHTFTNEACVDLYMCACETFGFLGIAAQTELHIYIHLICVLFVCRPTFKYFSWHTALLGFIGCLVMCFLINAIYASVAVVICLVMVIILHLRPFDSSWGSISQALIFHQVSNCSSFWWVRRDPYETALWFILGLHLTDVHFPPDMQFSLPL